MTKKLYPADPAKLFPYSTETPYPAYCLDHPTLGYLLYCSRIMPPLLAPLFIKVYHVVPDYVDLSDVSGELQVLCGLQITGETVIPLGDLERGWIDFVALDTVRLLTSELKYQKLI